MIKKCGANDLQDYRKGIQRRNRVEEFKARVLMSDGLGHWLCLLLTR